MLSVYLSVCLQHNLGTHTPIVLAFGISLKDLYGKEPIENGLGLVKIVKMEGDFSVFSLCFIST